MTTYGAQPNDKVSTPFSGPHKWYVLYAWSWLAGPTRGMYTKRIEVISKDWFLARAEAMIKLGCEAHQLELVPE